MNIFSNEFLIIIQNKMLIINYTNLNLNLNLYSVKFVEFLKI